MKTNFVYFILIILSSFGIKISAQSIYFLNPTNGEIFTGVGSQTTVYMQLQFGYNLSGDPNLTDHYIKLFRPPYSTQQSGEGGGITFDYSLPIGTYTWRLELWECYVGQGCFKVAEQTVTFYVKHTISVSNNFGGGYVKIDGATVGNGSPAYKFTGNNLLVGAIDQNYGGYYRLWNQSGYYNSNWAKKLYGGIYYSPISGGTPRDFNYTVASNDNGADVQGQLRKRLNNIIFQNNFVGVGNGGVIKVNSVQYNSPKSGVQVVEQNPVTGTAVTQTINGIQYTFNYWSDGSTTSSRTFYPPTDNTTYTAYYIGKPSNTYRNLHFSPPIAGQHITLYWNEHPNTNVTQYQVWRKVKHNGVVGDPVLIATKSRGTLTHVDNQYVYTSGYTDDLIWYDVRAYYNVESTYADQQWLAVYGEEITKRSDFASTGTEPLEFQVNCFPNPFNPVTNINVTIPVDGLLQVTIFNILGEKVLDLNNSIISKGIYEFSWNGTNASSNAVNSGIYIVLVKTDSQMLTQKLMLLK